MIFLEFSNAPFRFSLRRLRAEIMGCRSNAPPPPPSRRWKIQRPSRARADLICLCTYMSVRGRCRLRGLSWRRRCWLRDWRPAGRTSAGTRRPASCAASSPSTASHCSASVPNTHHTHRRGPGPQSPLLLCTPSRSRLNTTPDQTVHVC